MASVPLLQKNVRSQPRQRRQPARPPRPGTGGSRGSRCAAASTPDRRCTPRDPGCAWPSDVTPIPDTQVEIRPAVGVVETGALSPHERHRLTAVGLQDVLLLARPDVVEGRVHRTTCVQSALHRPGVAQLLEVQVASVGDHHVADAAAHRVAARLQLGHHPLVGGALPHEPRRVGARHARDRPPVRVEHARRPAGDHEPVARKPTARCDASVSAFTFSRSPRAVAPTHATIGT